MIGVFDRGALTVVAALGLLVSAPSLVPAVSTAAQCGDGTVYQAQSDTCELVSQQSPLPPAALPPPPEAPPPPPPPAWSGPTPRVSVGIGVCVPIPIIRICAGI